MNLQPSNRRQDLPVRLGSHGYRLDGDYALLNAELHLPPYFSEQGFGLELWACRGPHAGGSPEGVKIAEISLELPTPIGAYLHRVEARAALTPPPGDGEHSMVLMLVGGAGEARRVHDYANYSNLQPFSNPRFDGAVGYGIEGSEVLMSAQGVLNPRPEGNTSGSLSLELWASSEPYVSGVPRGHRMAGAELGSVFGQYVLPDVARRTAFTAPPPGQWHVALLLREWTVAQGPVTRDARVFDLKYEQPAPVAVAPVAVAPVAVAPAALAKKPSATAAAATVMAVKAPSPPEAKAPAALEAKAPAALEAKAPAAVEAKVEAPGAVAAKSAPAADAKTPVAATGTGTKALLSVNTGSVEELSKLPGLSLKVAKEIVKSRPFASVDALVDVRGVGEKTLRRIKSLLTL
jgi:DNA uptake protein ComE-like DNA-binding protein